MKVACQSNKKAEKLSLIHIYRTGEMKQWEGKEIANIMNNAIEGWKPHGTHRFGKESVSYTHLILLLSNFSTLKLLSDTLSPSQFRRKSIY